MPFRIIPNEDLHLTGNNLAN
jgi:hypothetical protein